jgi:3'(2'), 5'-bisphosphate nucleotidase
MTFHEDYGAWLAIARQAGWGAAEILLQAQSSFEVRQAGESPVTSADLAANDYILNTLQAEVGTADFAYLSEETYQSQPAVDRLDRPWVWIIDPLDGTKDFINRTGEFAVQIALTHLGHPVLAIVACPGLGKLYRAVRGGGTTVETKDGAERTLTVSQRQDPESLILVASRSHRSETLQRLLQQFPCQQQVQIGSIGCKIAAIVEQRADVYLSMSDKSAPKDWDLAAPELILTEAGGQLTRFDGSILQYNQADVNQWGGLLGSNGQCHATLCMQATELLERSRLA